MSKKSIDTFIQASLALFMQHDEFVAAVYALLSSKHSVTTYKDPNGMPYIEISHKEIATELGISKSSVSRSVSTLVSIGLVECFRAGFGKKSTVRVYPLSMAGIDDTEFIKIDLHLLKNADISLKCKMYYGLRVGLSCGKMSRAKCAAKLGVSERTITNWNFALESLGLIKAHFVALGKCLYIETLSAISVVKTRAQVFVESLGMKYIAAVHC